MVREEVKGGSSSSPHPGRYALVIMRLDGLFARINMREGRSAINVEFGEHDKGAMPRLVLRD